MNLTMDQKLFYIASVLTKLIDSLSPKLILFVLLVNYLLFLFIQP
jgi:hypothetical protein